MEAQLQILSEEVTSDEHGSGQGIGYQFPGRGAGAVTLGHKTLMMTPDDTSGFIRGRETGASTGSVSPCDLLCHVIMHLGSPYQTLIRCRDHDLEFLSLWNHESNQPLFFVSHQVSDMFF